MIPTIEHIAITVLNAVPNNPSPLRYRCMLCLNMYPIRRNTAETIRELRENRRLQVIICKDCIPLLSPSKGLNVGAGTNDMRHLLGLERIPVD